MARRKITKPAEGIDASELPDLTAKQQKFVRGILEGKTASDAYRAAYDAQNMSDEAIWVEASRLRSCPKVSLWVDTARQAGATKATVTLETHLTRLEELSTKAEKAGNYGAAVQAEQLKGKAVGLYVDRYQDVAGSGKLTANELVSAVSKLSPEAGIALSKALGLDQEHTQH